MTIRFAGSELSDFTVVTPNSSWAESSSTTFLRTGYCRRALTTAYPITTDYIETPAWTATAHLWISAWLSYPGNGTTATTTPFLQVYSGANRKIGLEFTGSGRIMQLVKWTTGGTKTVLATATDALVSVGATLAGRFTIDVDYQASGRVRVWLDGFSSTVTALILDYSGDVTTDGDTTLTKARFGHWGSSVGLTTSWSEVVAADVSTRAMSVVSLAPNGAGDVNAWTGAYTDVDETPASSADTIASTTAAQVFTCTTTALPSLSNHTVACVKVSVDALREASGPQNISLGVRQGGTNAFAASQALDTGYGVVSTYLQTNPVTSTAWGSSLTGTQLALRSET
jgi:hypothetical protein